MLSRPLLKAICSTFMTFSLFTSFTAQGSSSSDAPLFKDQEAHALFEYAFKNRVKNHFEVPEPSSDKVENIQRKQHKETQTDFKTQSCENTASYPSLEQQIYAAYKDLFGDFPPNNPPLEKVFFVFWRHVKNEIIVTNHLTEKLLKACDKKANYTNTSKLKFFCSQFKKLTSEERLAFLSSTLKDLIKNYPQDLKKAQETVREQQQEIKNLKKENQKLLSMNEELEDENENLRYQIEQIQRYICDSSSYSASPISAPPSFDEGTDSSLDLD